MEETQVVTESPVDEEIRDPKAVLEALQRAKEDAKKYREQFEAVESANKTLNERIAALEGDDGIAAYKRRVIELSAKQKLAQQGIKDVERIFGLLDASTLDLDTDGGLLGLDEGVTDLKKKLPELFDEKRKVGGAADAFEKEPVKQNLSSTEAQVKRIFNH
jgi:chromosome segregation ATPase